MPKHKKLKGASNFIPDPHEPPSTDGEKAVFSFEHIDAGHERHSDWGHSELCALLDMLQKASQRTWFQIKITGGKEKAGLGYTQIKGSNYSWPHCVPDNADMVEMRVNQRSRVFGFRRRSVFYVVVLDKDHKVCH